MACTPRARRLLLGAMAAAVLSIPAAAVELEPGRQPVQGKLADGDGPRWEVAVQAGELVEVEVLAARPGVQARLLDPAGHEILSRGDPMESPTPVLLRWTAAAPGRWTVELTPFPPVPPGGTAFGLWLPVRRRATGPEQREWERTRQEAEMLRSLAAGDGKRAAALLPALERLARGDLATDPKALAATLEDWGVRFSLACDTATAVALLQKATSLLERARADDFSIATSLNHLATLYFDLGKWGLGEDKERRALAIRRSHPAPRPVAESLRDLGDLLSKEGRYTEAIAALGEALSLFAQERPPRRDEIAETRGDLAEVHRARGDLAEARAGFDRALDEARSVQDASPLIYAAVLSNHAGLASDLGRYAEARTEYQRASEMTAAAGGDPAILATMVLNLADVSRRQKDYAAADEGFAQARKMAESALCPGHPDLLWFLNQQAVSRAEQGDAAGAEPLYRQALAIAEAAVGPDHLTVALGLHDLAGTLTALGRYDEAEQLYRRALAIRRRALGPGHPEAQATEVQLARLAFLRSGTAPAAALAVVDGALRSLERAQIYPDLAIDAGILKAEMLKKRGEEAPARKALARALDLIDAERPRTGGGEQTRTGYLRPYVRYFLRMVDWQIEAGDVEAALAFAERYRARVLQDQLAAAALDLREPAAAGSRAEASQRRQDSAEERIAELHRQLAFSRSRNDDSAADRKDRILKLEAQLAAAYRDYATAVEEMKNASSRWRNLEGKTIGLREIQSTVPADGFLLLYAIGDDASYAFLVPPAPDPPQARSLAVPAELATTLGVAPGPLTTVKARQLFSFTDAAPATVQEASSRLNALWRVLVPVELWTRLEQAAEVVVIPDRWLHGLPFEQLVVTPAVRAADVRYWLDAGPPLRYAPSAGSLYALGQRSYPGEESGAPPVLSVADPVFDPADLSGGTTGARKSGPRNAAERPLDRLPRTADETRAILDVFREVYGEGTADVLALTRERATERAVRAALPGKRFIHFGTHGVVDEQKNALFASLALTPPAAERWSTDDDGFLQLFEIYALRSSAELVVLSACESHAGPELEGEGVFALSRGFLAAGAKRVVASLWVVEEGSTAVLMKSFFRTVLSHYRDGQPIRYSVALRDAKREIRGREAWASPFFWAPFLLTGLE